MSVILTFIAFKEQLGRKQPKRDNEIKNDEPYRDSSSIEEEEYLQHKRKEQFLDGLSSSGDGEVEAKTRPRQETAEERMARTRIVKREQTLKQKKRLK